MEERDAKMRAHIKEQMDNNFEALRRLIDTNMRNRDQDGIRSGGFTPIDEEWEATANAAYTASRRSNRGPPSFSQRVKEH
jgi:hypothetical protein